MKCDRIIQNKRFSQQSSGTSGDIKMLLNLINWVQQSSMWNESFFGGFVCCIFVVFTTMSEVELLKFFSCDCSDSLKYQILLLLFSRRFAAPTTSTAALRATPATCRPEHVRRRTTTRSSTPSLRAEWYSPSPETPKKTYHVTARGSSAAPRETRAVGSRPQSGPAAPPPGYVHTSASCLITVIWWCRERWLLFWLDPQECGSCDRGASCHMIHFCLVERAHWGPSTPSYV